MHVKGSHTLVTAHLRNILVIQLGDIGDVVLTLPALRLLHQAFPAANLIVAVKDKTQGVLDDCPWVSGRIVIEKKKRKFWEELHYQASFLLQLWRYDFDLAFDLRTGTRGAILAFLSGAPQRVGYFSADGTLWRNRLFTHLVNIDHELPLYMASYLLRLFELYQLEKGDPQPRLAISQAKLAQARELLSRERIDQDRPLLAIQPFSLWGYKELGAAKTIALIQWLLETQEYTVIIIGAPGEEGRAAELTAPFPSRVYSLAGKTPLGLLGALLHHCTMLIGVDSAGLHFAAAVGTPTIGIYGPTPAEIWAPRGPGHLVIHKDLPCLPCRRMGCDNSRRSRCLEELSLAEMIPQIQGHLAAWRTR